MPLGNIKLFSRKYDLLVLPDGGEVGGKLGTKKRQLMRGVTVYDLHPSTSVSPQVNVFSEYI